MCANQIAQYRRCGTFYFLILIYRYNTHNIINKPKQKGDVMKHAIICIIVVWSLLTISFIISKPTQHKGIEIGAKSVMQQSQSIEKEN